MLLYDSFGPNPRAMRMFLAEKGITILKKDIDLMNAENRRPPYTDRNPGGQLPALELDNGKCIGETVAIWEYLEEKNPNPPLIGSTLLGKPANVRAHIAICGTSTIPMAVSRFRLQSWLFMNRTSCARPFKATKRTG